jgi:hypothetical protein
VRWILEAQKRGYDCIILVIDQDGFAEWAKQISDAQNSTISRLPRALGVAIRTFDAWMRADEKALTNALACKVVRQSEPETIAEPKEIARELFGNSDQRAKPSELYARIANAIDLDVLQSRCPKGFATFAERVRRL